MLSCGYLPTQIEEFFGARRGRARPRVPRRGRAARHRRRRSASRPRASTSRSSRVNGDCCAGRPRRARCAFHRESGAQATILLTPVADPTPLRPRPARDDGARRRLPREAAPEEIDTDLINAGLYVLEPAVLDADPARPAGLDRARGLSAPRRGGPCYGLALPGYWLDVGTPESLPAGAPRRARAERRDRGRRAARPRLHALSTPARGRRAGAAGATGLRRAARSARARAIGSVAVVGRGASRRARRGRRQLGDRRRARGSATACTVRRLARRRGRRARRGLRGARACRSSGLVRGRRSGIDSPRASAVAADAVDPGRRALSSRDDSHLTRPNFDRPRPLGRSTPRRVEKPWGYELIWALTDAYCGKLLFVKAGQSLCLQFHKEKDEAWYVQSGRARARARRRRARRCSSEEIDRPGRRVPLRARAPSTASRRSRTRRSSRSRRRSSTTSSGSRTPTGARDSEPWPSDEP